VRSVEITEPKADASAPMTYWTGADLPFYHGLAQTFPVADRWFGSCLGPTFPNRRFLIAGTAHGLIDDLPFCMVDCPPAGTIFDRLDQYGISWVNYHNVSPVKVLLKRLLGRPGLVAMRRLASVSRWLPPLVNAVKGNKSFTADLYPLGLRSAAEVINRVTHGRGWAHTLLIWPYDEHGGYYDHVPPPAAPPRDRVAVRVRRPPVLPAPGLAWGSR
jgi:phospholipase C